MEVGVAEAVGGECVDVGGVDVGSVAAELCEAEVVEQHDDDVGGVFAGVGRFGEPRLGFGVGLADGSLPFAVLLHELFSWLVGRPCLWTGLVGRVCGQGWLAGVVASIG